MAKKKVKDTSNLEDHIDAHQSENEGLTEGHYQRQRREEAERGEPGQTGTDIEPDPAPETQG